MEPTENQEPITEEALPCLTPAMNKVLRLFLEGAKTQQIAETLGVHNDTVRKTMHRILARFRVAPIEGEDLKVRLLQTVMENGGQWRVEDQRQRLRKPGRKKGKRIVRNQHWKLGKRR